MRVRIGTLGLGLLATMAAVSPAVGQGCGWTGKIGLSAPASDLPAGGSMQQDLEPGPGFGIGRLCLSSMGPGVEIMFRGHGAFQTLHLLGSLGPRISLGSGERSPWLRIAAQVGPALVMNLGNESLVLEFGPRVREPSLGFDLGGALQLGLETGSGAILVEGSLLGVFVDREDVVPGVGVEDRGLGGFLSTAVTVGYLLRP